MKVIAPAGQVMLPDGSPASPPPVMLAPPPVVAVLREVPPVAAVRRWQPLMVERETRVTLPDGTPAPLPAPLEPPEPLPALVILLPPRPAPAPPEPRWRVVFAPYDVEPAAPAPAGWATLVGVVGANGTTLTATPADLTAGAIVDITDFTIVTLDAGSIA